jgi:serine phosphatase RsbU (regulator of sigma subunit)
MVLNPDGTVLLLSLPTADLLLGVVAEAPRRESEVTVDRGALVLLYTDGLVERRGQSLDDGLERLRQTLADLVGLDLDSICDELLRRMLPDHPDDDVALVAVLLHSQNRPRPSEAGPNRIPPNVPSSPRVTPQPD